MCIKRRSRNPDHFANFCWRNISSPFAEHSLQNFIYFLFTAQEARIISIERGLCNKNPRLPPEKVLGPQTEVFYIKLHPILSLYHRLHQKSIENCSFMQKISKIVIIIVKYWRIFDEPRPNLPALPQSFFGGRK